MTAEFPQRFVATVEEACLESAREGVVLIGDLFELARLMLARLKVNLERVEAVEDLEVIERGMHEVHAMVASAKMTVEASVVLAQRANWVCSAHPAKGSQE